MFIEAPKASISKIEEPSDKYNSLKDLLIHEMIVSESKLTDNTLLEMADMYGLDFWELKAQLPEAEISLYNQLHDSLDILED